MALINLEITGGIPLRGELEVQGSKNAVLPILAGCILGEGVCILENCPEIGDVEDTISIMRRLGCSVQREGRRVTVDASGMHSWEISGKEAVRIRSSVLFLGALLGRMKKAVLPMPGGCAIGKRPIDLHLEALARLGVTFSGAGQITAETEKLRGNHICLLIPSVGATENAILAAVAAEGETRIQNAAREPEIDELCVFLSQRGAMIQRTREGDLVIQGGRPLGPVRHRMRADRIVTGTYLLAAAATGGEIFLKNTVYEEQAALIEILERMGGKAENCSGGIRLKAAGRPGAVPFVETAPYPGFPTDLQSPLLAVLCRAEGESRICEKIFESRFRTVEELRKMGAQIEIAGKCAKIKGKAELLPARLEAPDLRGGAALVIAALQAEGKSRISGTEYIRRGYEDIVRDLRTLGAKGCSCPDAGEYMLL